MSGIRVHFFTNYVHEQGTYFRAHKLAVGLVRLGQRVTVFGCDTVPGAQSREEERDGVRYVITRESWKTSVFSEFNHPLTALRRSLASYPPCDVAHLFQPFLGAAAAWRRNEARVRFYDWDDQWTGGLIRGPARSWRHWWPRFIIRRLEERLPRLADHVTAISRYLADLARLRGARAVTLINSGAWPAEPAPRAAARAAVGLRPDAMYVGFMGYTVAELPWCLEALAANTDRHPQLRLALCGGGAEALAGVPVELAGRIDHLGRLPAAKARQFAAALDLALLPMEDNTFNRSRLPQKYGDHLVTGVPLLCSDVGECGRLNARFPWVFPAGSTKAEWLRSFAGAVDRLARGDRPEAEPGRFADELSWAALSHKLLDAYRRQLSARVNRGAGFGSRNGTAS